MMSLGLMGFCLIVSGLSLEPHGPWNDRSSAGGSPYEVCSIRNAVVRIGYSTSPTSWDLGAEIRLEGSGFIVTVGPGFMRFGFRV